MSWWRERLSDKAFSDLVAATIIGSFIALVLWALAQAFGSAFLQLHNVGPIPGPLAPLLVFIATFILSWLLYFAGRSVAWRLRYETVTWINPNLPGPTALHTGGPGQQQITLPAPEHFQNISWDRLRMTLTYMGCSRDRRDNIYAAHVRAVAAFADKELTFTPGPDAKEIGQNIFRLPIRTLSSGAGTAIYARAPGFTILVVSAEHIDPLTGVLTLGIYFA